MVEFYAKDLIDVLKKEEIALTDFASGSILGLNDRFTAEFPYANIKIKVRIFMNPKNLDDPPDIIVLSPIIDFSIHYDFLFHDWDIYNPQALLIIVDRVKRSISNYFLNIFDIVKDPIQEYIFRSCKNLLIQGNYLEINIDYLDSHINSIFIAFAIPVDLNNQSYTRQSYLHISHSIRHDKIQVDIVHPKWASHLVNITPQKIQASSLTSEKFEERIRQIFTYLTKEIKALSNSKSYRKEFFEKLLKMKIGILLEMDTCEYLKICFHKEYVKERSKEIMNVLVILTNDFPKSNPQFKLRSMSSTKNCELREKKYIRVKMWDSDADIESLAAYLISSINEEIPSFLSWLNL